MKSWTVQIYFVVVVLVAVSLFIRLPVSSASSTIQADTKQLFGLSTKLDTEDTDRKKKKKKKLFFRQTENKEKSVDTEDTDKKKKQFFGSSFKSENKEKSDDIEDTDTGTDKKPISSSWQFFNRNKKSNDDASGGEGDSEEVKPSPTSTEKDENKKRFQFQFRRREKELDGKDPKENDSDEVGEKVNEEVDGELDIEEKKEQGKVKESEKVKENDSESSSSSDKVEDDDKSDSQTSKDDPQSDPDQEEKKDEDKEKENDSQQAAQQQYRNQLMLKQQQLVQSPGAIFYRPTQLPQQGFPQQQQPSSPSAIPSAQGQIMAASAIVNVLGLVSRFFFIKWIINKLAFESESMSPTQHFMWECLNDKFVKDNEIWNRVLRRVPQSMKVSRRKWGNTVKAMGPDNINMNKTQQNKIAQEEDQVEQQQQSTGIPKTSKTVVVMDFSTMNVPDPDFLRFADVVTFLVGSNNPRKQLFGKKPEVIIILQSPGGEVTSFAFAAAQVARLRSAGWKVTISVDRIAASGGYMIASQATQILASPFAMVGSIGVITETLNFYETLKKYGVKSLVLKAGDMKNPITQYGEVSKEDIQNTQEDLEEIHESFINLCRLRRPALDLEVCNGRVLSGDRALEKGMIDRILTSDEYIMEKMSEGDLVMKLHLVNGRSEHNMIARALELLPHLSSKLKRFISTSTTGSGINAAAAVGRRNASTSMIQMDGNVANKVVQVVGLACMIQRAIARTGFFVSS